MASTARLVKAVIFGGVALIIGLIFGILLDGFVDQFTPEAGSTLELILDNFMVIWILALLVGVFVVVLNVADVV